MPTSVALHVLRGLQQKLFIEYHRFIQHKQANPSQAQHVVGLCTSQAKAGVARASRALCLASY